MQPFRSFKDRQFVLASAPFFTAEEKLLTKFLCKPEFKVFLDAQSAIRKLKYVVRSETQNRLVAIFLQFFLPGNPTVESDSLRTVLNQYNKKEFLGKVGGSLQAVLSVSKTAIYHGAEFMFE